jgi:hypothetical protein
LLYKAIPGLLPLWRVIRVFVPTAQHGLSRVALRGREKRPAFLEEELYVIIHCPPPRRDYSGSPFPNSSGSRAMWMAIRRASSFVGTFASRASSSLLEIR